MAYNIDPAIQAELSISFDYVLLNAIIHFDEPKQSKARSRLEIQATI